MRLAGAALLLAGAWLWSDIARGSEHRPPVADHTVDVLLEEADEGRSLHQEFRYESEAVFASGSIRYDSQTGQFAIGGEYVSRQGLEEEVALAFQLFDAEGRLLFKEGGRTPFKFADGEARARFEYRRILADWKVPAEAETITLRFNYVKEHEYWADQRFPDLELPALRISPVRRKAIFEVVFSWVPYFVPREVDSYSVNWIRYDGEALADQPYRASVESYFLDTRERKENARYGFDSAEGWANRLWLARMRYERAGAVNRRLGFVLEGVRWLPRPPETYRKSVIVPVWAYSALVFGGFGVVAGAWSLGQGLRRRWGRWLARGAAVLFGLVLALEFASPLLLVYLALLGAIGAAGRPGARPAAKAYWVVFLFAFSQELLWPALQGVRIGLHGTLFSLGASAWLLAPLLLLRRPWSARLWGNAALLAIGGYYATASLYHAFFQDFPSWNAVTYAWQGVHLGGSVLSLLEERHCAALIAFGVSAVALNAGLRRVVAG